MAVITGNNGELKVVASGGTPLNLVGQMKTWSVEETQEQVETTVMTDTSKTFANTLKTWTASCEVNYDPADTNGQLVMTIGQKVDVEFYPNGASNTTKLNGTAFVTSMGRSASMGDLVGKSISMQGTGALTETA